MLFYVASWSIIGRQKSRLESVYDPSLLYVTEMLRPQLGAGGFAGALALGSKCGLPQDFGQGLQSG
jgi:hypothetical protein